MREGGNLLVVAIPILPTQKICRSHGDTKGLVEPDIAFVQFPIRGMVNRDEKPRHQRTDEGWM